MPALPSTDGSQSTGESSYNTRGDNEDDYINHSQNLDDNIIEPFGGEYNYISQDNIFNEHIHHYMQGILITN